MAKQMKYRVVREHYGYAEGAERIALPSDVAHLVPAVLEPISEVDDPVGKKAEAPHPNKAETAPKNKAEKPGKAKGK